MSQQNFANSGAFLSFYKARIGFKSFDSCNVM